MNSKGGEREVASFYEYAYLQSEDEIKENLDASIPEMYEEMVLTSEEMYNKIEKYSLEHKQTIPKVKVKDYSKNAFIVDKNKYPIIYYLFNSDNIQERYWINECYISLLEKENNKEIDYDQHNVYMDRLEIEADIIFTVGEKLEDCLYSYFNTFKHYIDLFWSCGSIVGPGRGSSTGFLSNFLLGITQLDPIQWNLYYWRFLNKERVNSLPDIDIDLAPSKKLKILKEIKKERGGDFNKGIDDLSRKNLGCTLVATFGTEGTRSTILTACRGYRSEDFPDGIDSDTAQYLSSLIPSERGFLWPLSDVVNGNEEKERKPIKTFINEINNYPGLLNIMINIEGLINKRSSHASGVIFFDKDPYEFGCFMKTPKGEIITQWELHGCESAGMTKYDLLVTEVSDKIIQTLKFLYDDNLIKGNNLRDLYNKYLHPQVIDIKDKKIWKALKNGEVLDCFQFSTDVGLSAAKKLKPDSPEAMTQANALMRLMSSETGAESPIDKYARFKNNFPYLWEKEMQEYHLTKEEIEIIRPIYEPSYGCPSIQEDLMVLLMRAANFSLLESDDARKIVAKKQMKRIPELKAHIFNNIEDINFANYIWNTGVKPQLGYAFNRSHSLPYSFVGIQTLMLATKWNPIYWNTACLIVNSGSLEEDVEYEIEESENGEIVKKKSKSTDYAKVAKALGDIISKGIKVSLIDINRSNYSFEPDIENNQILFGMKAVNGINDLAINSILENRPYKNFIDFLNRCKLNKAAMISLIKAGSFDQLEIEWANELNIEPRLLIMVLYLSRACEPKKRLTLQNFNGLIQKDLIPESLMLQKRIYLFNKYLKENRKANEYYTFDNICLSAYQNNDFDLNKLEVIDGQVCILQKVWDNIYKKEMDITREWLKQNQEDILKEFNYLLFKETWNKYAVGSISAWEMESLCFYYHDHELKNVNVVKYGISNFFSMPEQPVVDYFFKRNGNQIPIYKTYKIIGTVISKDDTRSSVSILTVNGVVNVKFTKEYYANFNRQISEVQDDGTKKVKEKGWFSRGTKVMVTGFRREDTFVSKTYKKTLTHQLYKIIEVKENGDIILEHERYKVGDKIDDSN